MNDISIGAVGAAIIAGLVSVLGLIIGKEQKVSEFRQAWIDDLRKCLVAYLVQINAISDALRAASKPGAPSASAIMDSYKALNEASHGITFRINPLEAPAKRLLEVMESFEGLASSKSTLTPTNIKALEIKYVSAAKALLKYEWVRVKRGETAYQVTKWLLIVSLVLMLGTFGLLWHQRAGSVSGSYPAKAASGQTINNLSISEPIAPGHPACFQSVKRPERRHRHRVSPTPASLPSRSCAAPIEANLPQASNELKL